VLTTGTSFVERNATTSIDVISTPGSVLVDCSVALDVDATLTSRVVESIEAGARIDTASVATVMNAAARPAIEREVAGWYRFIAVSLVSMSML
jgi:hypothetical protein